MATIHSGDYIIKNAQYHKNARLEDDYDGALVSAGSGGEGEKWHIERLEDGNYSLVNHQYGDVRYACAGTNPPVGARIVGKNPKEAPALTEEWSIQQTEAEGEYMITKADCGLYWSLRGLEIGNPVELTDSCQNKYTHWVFERA